MWPLVLFAGAAISIVAYAVSKKKRAATRPTAPAAHRDHVDAQRAAVRRTQTPTAPQADPTTLSSRAALIAAYLRKYQHQYDPAVIRDFQALAGLTPDGVYGRATRAALIHYGVAPALAPAALGTSTRLFGRA